MKNNFNDCLQRLLKDEGGYTNDPRDPGGPTNFGITLTDYRKYISSKGTAEDVRRMTVEQASAIYKTKYWDALNCDSLPSGVDYTCFDYGVNSGLARPRKALVKFGNKTGAQLIDAINDERMAFLRSLKTFPAFGKGWTRRVNGVRAYSKVLATKKDNVTGPIIGGAVAAGSGLTMWQQFNNIIHAHPYLTVTGILFVALGIGYAVHYFKNKGK